jgi:DNA adenine methylase
MPIEQAQRLRPPFKSTGGKFYLAPKIIPHLPKQDRYKFWIENFARGFSLTLAMPKRNGVMEFWNDLDARLFNLMRVLVNDCAKFVTALANVQYDEETFLAARNQDKAWHPRSVDNFERSLPQAINTFIRLNMSRGGNGEAFAWSDRLRGGQPGDLNAWLTRLELLPAIAERLSDVNIACECGISLMERLGGRHDIFQYCDSPYMPKTRTAKKVYGEFEMSPAEHERMATIAQNCKGPVMISGYRCSEYDVWYKEWRRIDFSMPNNAGQTKTKERRIESIWMNY